MFKTFITCCFFFIFFTNCVFSETETASEEDLIEIVNKLDKINKRLKKIEQNLDIETYKKLEHSINNLNLDMNEQEQILQKVERKTLVDKMQIKAELRTRFDWYDFKGHDNEPFIEKYKTDEIQHERINLLPSNRLRLNLKANLSKNIRFHSRLVMFRNWFDDDVSVYPEATFLNNARIPSDIKLKVERAYIDFFFNYPKIIKPALTFGRIPTTDGLPTDFRENTPRKSTYPGIAYDVETDAIAFSFDISELIHMPGAAIRTMCMIRTDDNEKYSYFGQKLSDKKKYYRVDELAEDPLYIYAFQFETNLNTLFNDSFFIFNSIFIPETSNVDLRYVPEIYPLLDESIPYLFTEKNDKLGSLNKLTFYFQSKNIFNSSFDIFSGISFVKTRAKGALKIMFNPESLGLPGEPILARDAYDVYKDKLQSLVEPLNALKNAPPPIGLLNDDGISDRSAWAMHLGFRYKLPFDIIKNPKFGVEFNKGSKYWFGVNDASEDPMHKLNTRGYVWDFYYNQTINSYFSVRFGYTYTKHEYDQGLSFYYGQPLKIDHRISNTYFLLDGKI